MRISGTACCWVFYTMYLKLFVWEIVFLGLGPGMSLSLPFPPCLSLRMHEGSQGEGQGLCPGLCVHVDTAV